MILCLVPCCTESMYGKIINTLTTFIPTKVNKNVHYKKNAHLLTKRHTNSIQGYALYITIILVNEELNPSG